MKKNPMNIEAIKKMHEAGELDAAKTAYLQALKEQPHHAELLHRLGILCAQQENFSEAIDYLERALTENPNQPNIQLHLATLQKAQGLFQRAEKTLQNLLAAHPDYAPALNNLGSVYYALGKLNDAVRFFHRAIEIQPNYVDAYYNLGLALLKQNLFDEAIKAFQLLLKLAPKHAPAYFQMGCAKMQQNKIDEAIESFLWIDAAHPNHIETQMNLAACFLKKNDLTAAKNHYLKALSITPNDTQILFNLGVVNMQLGQIDSAIQFYQRAVNIDPDFFAAHNNLGVAFLARQHIPFALNHFKEALRIQPNNRAIEHTVQVLSGDKRLIASPPDYLKNLFDSYADHYEMHLLTALEYNVPTLLLNAVREVKPSLGELNILDLGCGTGLCGDIFKPFAKKLDGVDLSEKMLAVARGKNIYDELAAESLEDFLLSKHTAEYDLILAGDVFVYSGDLSITFELVRKALHPKGLFAFNTEITEENDFKINQSGRFGHHKNYIQSLAEKNHFRIAFYKTEITRMQNNEPVYGHLYVLEFL